MTKNRLSEMIKSIFGSHIDPEIDENYRKTKSDIDSKVEKIVKLMNEDETDKIIIGDMKKEPIIEMIEDFQEKYHLLYARYESLTGKIREQAQSNGNENKSSSSLSSSDSDPSKKYDDFQERAAQEGKLSDAFEENQAYKNAALRIFNIIAVKMGNLQAENKDLKLQLGNGRIVEAELNEKLEDMNGEKVNNLLEVDNKLKEKVDNFSCKDNENISSCKIKKLKSGVDNFKIQKGELKKHMTHNLEMESSSLRARKINLDSQIETQKLESAMFLTQEIQKIILECQIETQKQESVKFLRKEIQNMILENQIETQNKESAEFLTQEIQKIKFDKLTEENEKVRKMFNECKEKFQSYIKIVTEVIGKVDFTLVVLRNVVTRIFEEDLKNYENSISRIEKEVNDQDLACKEMIGNLERKALEEKAEGEKLEAILKEKEERVMSLGEEKREVIKQLCLSIEFYRTRCDELKEMIAEMVADRSRRSTIFCM